MNGKMPMVLVLGRECHRCVSCKKVAALWIRAGVIRSGLLVNGP